MAKEFAKGFYNSKMWKKCREAYIKHREAIDGGMCETCHEEPGYIVHHKVGLTPSNINNTDIALSFKNYNTDIALSFKNLKYDCHICHNKEDKKEEINGLVRVEFDEEGNVICQAPP